MIVLVVEDSEVVRKQLVDLIHEAADPVETLEAATPKEAMLLLRARAPHVMLLDLALREGNGFEIMDRMKVEGHTTPVVVLTNHATASFRKLCLRAGARYFFDKALEFEKAVAAIGQLGRDAAN